MTENEAIEIIKKHCEGCEHHAGIECFAQGEEGICWEVKKRAIMSLRKVQEYKTIGTVEECRAAMEKQRAIKPILCMNEVSGMFVDYADGHGEYKTQMNNWWRCPCCNEVVGQRVIVHKHIHDQRKKKYCEKCGQAISWDGDAP